MRPACCIVLVLAVVLMGILPSAALAEGPPSYIVLKGGIYSPSKDFDLNNINVDSTTGFNGEIAFGYYLIPAFATELGVGYFESKGSPAAQPGDLKLKVV